MIVQRLLSQVDTTSAETVRATLSTLLTGLSHAIDALQIDNQALIDECVQLTYDVDVAHIAASEAERRLARLQAAIAALPPLPDLPDVREALAGSLLAAEQARMLAERLIEESDLAANPDAARQTVQARVSDNVSEYEFVPSFNSHAAHTTVGDLPVEPSLTQAIDEPGELETTTSAEPSAVVEDDPGLRRVEPASMLYAGVDQDPLNAEPFDADDDTSFVSGDNASFGTSWNSYTDPFLPAPQYVTGPFFTLTPVPFGSDWDDEEDTVLGRDSDPDVTLIPEHDLPGPEAFGLGAILPEYVDRAVLFGLAPQERMLETESLPAVPVAAAPARPLPAFGHELAAVIVLLPVTALTVYAVQQFFAGTTPGLLIAYLLVGLITSAILAPIVGIAGGIDNLRSRGSAAFAASLVDGLAIVLGIVLPFIEPAWLAPGIALALIGAGALVLRAVSRKKSAF